MLATGEQKPLEDVLQDFEKNLKMQRLSALDYTTYHQKGSEQLQAFLESQYDSFNTRQKAELSFAGQEVFLGDAHLTGKLDVVELNKAEKTMIVTDYKTGKPATGWKGSDDNEKVKLHKYRQQLLFYKLLVEHSRDYRTYSVDQGKLSFVEPTKAGDVIVLDMSFDSEEVARFARLIEKIWDRIVRLDLPDTSGYDASLKGMLAFEEDLLNDAV